MNASHRDSLRTLGELLVGFHPTYVRCSPSTPIRSVCIDSRRLQPGDLFVAQRGSTFDGHNFLESAAQAKASAALIACNHVSAPSIPHVCIPSPEEAIPIIAGRYYNWPNKRLSMTGITGTNGKTTTSFLFGSILQQAGYRYLRIGTSGNWVVNQEEPAEFTTPFPLELQALFSLAVQRGASHAVMEVSSHALDQQRVAGLEFRCVALTSFSQDHLDYHGNFASYLAAKCRLAEQHLTTTGTAIAAIDEQEQASFFLQHVRSPAVVLRVSKGPHPEAEIFADSWRQSPLGIQAKVRTPWGSLNIRSPLLGSFNLDNILTAAALALSFEIEPDSIEQALMNSAGAPGRMERVQIATENQPTVFVDYAHTPDAVERALTLLRQTTSGRLIVVLGCGGNRDRAKRPKMAVIASRESDVFVATSDNPRSEDPEQILDDMLGNGTHCRNVVRICDRQNAIRHAIMDAKPSDTVLIAGKGHENYQIIGTKKIYFDDREQARLALLARQQAQT